MTASASHVSYRCTITRQVTHKTFLVPLWLSNTLPPFPDLYFPVGHSRANPKSLPASPWRQASVEQMASVCRAAIKEEATSGEMKVGQDQGGGDMKLPLPQACARTYALAHLATHTRTHACMFMPRCTFPAKTNTRPTPITKHQQCENEKRG